MKKRRRQKQIAVLCSGDFKENNTFEHKRCVHLYSTLKRAHTETRKQIKFLESLYNVNPSEGTLPWEDEVVNHNTDYKTFFSVRIGADSFLYSFKYFDLTEKHDWNQIL